MAKVRSCVYLLVLLVLVQRTVSTPIFGSSFLCSLFCTSDDDDSGSIEDYISSYLFGDDSDESSAPDEPSPAKPAAGGGKPQEISLSIPPANGVNVTLQNNGNSWFMNLIPWPFSGGSATTAAPPPAVTTPAGNETAANTTAAA